MPCTIHIYCMHKSTHDPVPQASYVGLAIAPELHIRIQSGGRKEEEGREACNFELSKILEGHYSPTCHPGM